MKVKEFGLKFIKMKRWKMAFKLVITHKTRGC